MDGRSGPWTVVLSKDAFSVEFFGNLPFRFSLVHEQLVDIPNNSDLTFRAWDQDDSVSLEALTLTSPQESLRTRVSVDQLPSQTVSGWAALPKSQFDESTLTKKNLH